MTVSVFSASLVETLNSRCRLQSLKALHLSGTSPSSAATATLPSPLAPTCLPSSSSPSSPKSSSFSASSSATVLPTQHHNHLSHHLHQHQRHHRHRHHHRHHHHHHHHHHKSLVIIFFFLIMIMTNIISPPSSATAVYSHIDDIFIVFFVSSMTAICIGTIPYARSSRSHGFSVLDSRPDCRFITLIPESTVNLQAPSQGHGPLPTQQVKPAHKAIMSWAPGNTTQWRQIRR